MAAVSPPWDPPVFIQERWKRNEVQGLILGSKYPDSALPSQGQGRMAPPLGSRRGPNALTHRSLEQTIHIHGTAPMSGCPFRAALTALGSPGVSL